MSLVNNKCLRISEELVKKCVISDNNILSYFPVTLQDYKENIALNITTEKDEYTFVIRLFQNEDGLLCGLNENINESPKFCIKDENILMEVRDIAIHGYTLTEPEEVSILHLKSILKYLAHSHSKDFGKVFNQLNHSLNENGYENIQHILFDLAEITNAENIDVNTFKDGVEKLSFSSDEVLKLNKGNVYVCSKILKSKLFFKYNENRTMTCKIINLAPEKYLPLVYDVLLAIFYFSDNKIRQYHFHELLDYYYNTLKEILHPMNFGISTILSREKFNTQIKTFTPYIKLEMAYRLCHELSRKVTTVNEADLKSRIRNFLNKNIKYENLLSTSIFEIYECILYSNLSREDCYKIVRNNIGSSDYEFLNWKLTLIDTRSGFLGDYYKLKINIKQQNEYKTLHLFAKYLPTTNQVALKMAKLSFEKEKFFYETFISELKSLGLEDITDFSPECYFAKTNDVLIFEDVSLLNYSSLDPSEPFSYETMQVVIRQLAKLHACSFLYEEIKTEKAGKLVRIDDKFEKYIQEMFVLRDMEPNSNKIIKCGIDAVFDYILDAFPDIPKNLTMDEFKVKARKVFDSLFEKVKKSNKFRNVLCQGDIWGNNILFKKDRHNKPITCCIVDYQLNRYCPPSHDLLFFLYLNTDNSTRSKYMTKLIEEYYVELSSILKRYSFDLNKIYTYEEFLDSCRYMKSAAVCITLIYFQLTMYPPEKMQNIISDEKRATYVFTEDRKELLDEMQYNDVYRQTIKETVENLYELCENDFI